ncbi:MAG: trans-sulfuration enzyme family protein [Thermoplasmataceae archaeon]
MRIETKAIHVGEEPDFRAGSYGDVTSPIHLSSTFATLDIDRPTGGYDYSRSGNPTRNALEQKLAAIENADHGLAFSSGLAAESTVCLSLVKPGENIVAFNDLYGGTRRLFDQILAGDFSIGIRYVDARDPENIKKVIDSKTKLVYLESPTNPLLKMADIKSISDIAHERDIPVAVDNTFASPYFQNPLDLDADIVIHSTTKYINGHSDSIGGAVMVNRDDLYSRFKFEQNAIGAILSPFDSFLVMRGIRTLGVRMRQHAENAMKIAEFLETRNEVKKVIYPGLASHPQHDLAGKQMKGFGGMLSFELEATAEKIEKFLKTLKVFSLAESLGGVESLIEIPARMTHKGVPSSERKSLGISDSLIRMSAGIENVQDLIEDLENAFLTL